MSTNDNTVTLETFDYSNEDYILVRYPLDGISYEVLEDFYEKTCEKFPSSKVIGVPKDISIENCGREVLTNIYNTIKRELGL